MRYLEVVVVAVVVVVVAVVVVVVVVVVLVEAVFVARAIVISECEMRIIVAFDEVSITCET